MSKAEDKITNPITSVFVMLAGMGLENYQGRVRQRLSALNICVVMVTAFGLTYLGFYTLYDFEGLQPLIYGILIQVILFAFTPALHRFGELAAGIYFVIVWISLIWYFSTLLGRDSGVHFYFFPGAVGMLIIFGFRRIKVASMLALLPLALFLYTEYSVLTPASIVRTDPTFMAILYFVAVAGTYSIIFVLVGYSLYLTRVAEVALAREYKRSEQLLENLLPASVAERLKNEPDKIIADDLGQISILFADIVDFTPRASSLPPNEVVGFLNEIFTAFDELSEHHRLEKIKTIGDAYMVAAGMPDPRQNHTEAIADMALDMIAATERISQQAGETIAVRIGMHTGPAIAGVIGTRKFFYDVWGDTVNTASRMESSSDPGRIQVTPEVKDTLSEQYSFEERGQIEIKGKGLMTTWWLLGRKS